MNLARLLLAIVLVGLVLTPSPGRCDDISSIRYDNLLNEYLRADTEEKRRAEIVEVFRLGVLRDTLRKDLTRHIGKADTRVRALELAAALQVDRLHKKIQKEIDGPAEAAAVKYMFATQDPGSTEQLYERWETKPMDGESFKLVREGFMANLVRMQTLEKFFGYIKGKNTTPERVESARRILMFQMGHGPDDTAIELETAWKAFKAQDTEDTRLFSLEKDKLRMTWEDFWKTGRIRMCNQNYKLYPGATLELYRVPDLIQDSTVYMKCWMRVLSGNGAKFALHVVKDPAEPKDPAPGPLVKDGRWVLSTTGRDRPESQVDPGVWERLTLYFLADRQTQKLYDRPQCVVTVENKLTYDVGALNGKFEKMVITAGESTLVVGGLHFHFKE